MIYILSAGRSGSAWLSTVFCALGLRCRHESRPVIADVDVLSDTSWMWNQGSLINWLTQRNTLNVTDTVILLERPREEIERSITELIGERDWNRNFQAWEQLKHEVWNKGLTQILRSTFKINYTDLFEDKFPTTLKHILSSSGHHRDLHEIKRVWEFMTNMRIVNKASEEETIQSYGYGIGN